MPPAMRQIAKIRMYQSASVSRMRAHIVASPRGSKDRVFARRHLSEREAKFDRNVGRFSRHELLSSGARVTRAKKQCPPGADRDLAHCGKQLIRSPCRPPSLV